MIYLNRAENRIEPEPMPKWGIDSLFRDLMVRDGVLFFRVDLRYVCRWNVVQDMVLKVSVEYVMRLYWRLFGKEFQILVPIPSRIGYKLMFGIPVSPGSHVTPEFDPERWFDNV